MQEHGEFPGHRYYRPLSGVLAAALGDLLSVAPETTCCSDSEPMRTLLDEQLFGGHYLAHKVCTLIIGVCQGACYTSILEFGGNKNVNFFSNFGDGRKSE